MAAGSACAGSLSRCTRASRAGHARCCRCAPARGSRESCMPASAALAAGAWHGNLRRQARLAGRGGARQQPGLPKARAVRCPLHTCTGARTGVCHWCCCRCCTPQVYPDSPAQAEMMVAAAMKVWGGLACGEHGPRPRASLQHGYNSLRAASALACAQGPHTHAAPPCNARRPQVGFSGGLVVDFPHSTRAKKFFLVLMVGAGGVQGLWTVLVGARGSEGSMPSYQLCADGRPLSAVLGGRAPACVAPQRSSCAASCSACRWCRRWAPPPACPRPRAWTAGSRTATRRAARSRCALRGALRGRTKVGARALKHTGKHNAHSPACARTPPPSARPRPPTGGRPRAAAQGQQAQGQQARGQGALGVQGMDPAQEGHHAQTRLHQHPAGEVPRCWAKWVAR